MQREINDHIHLAKTVNLFKSILKVRLIDQTVSDFLNVDEKVGKIKRLVNKDKYDKNVVRYVPRTLN